MSKGFILFIKVAMLCLLERHTEIFIEEIMCFTRFASKQYWGGGDVPGVWTELVGLR